jgi:hypothetical protein
VSPGVCGRRQKRNGPSEYVDNWLGGCYEYPKLKKNEKENKKRRALGALKLLSSQQLISLVAGGCCGMEGDSASRATIGRSLLEKTATCSEESKSALCVFW